MAKQHHCPNHGSQTCNALSGRIHICPICYTRWEEDVGPAAQTTEEPL